MENLGFVFLFKIELLISFMGVMSNIFYKEIGFKISEIAIYSKFFGGFATILFTLLLEVIVLIIWNN